MDDKLANDTHLQLESVLSQAAPEVLVMFGATLFHKFMEKGWIAQEVLFGSLSPAYKKTHLAVFNPFIPESEFVVVDQPHA